MDDAGNDWLSYGELSDLAQGWATRISGPRALVFLYIRNDIDSVAALIGALSAGHAIALCDPRLPLSARRGLEEAYRPTWVIGPDSALVTHPDCGGPLHPGLAVLLSTSGSTGSAKLVRLTLGAIHANAEAIGKVLHIDHTDVAAGHLPLHYSYGMSVLSSHLARGARIRLTEMGFTDRSFWPAMRVAGVTHMPGVPFHHEIMLKLGLERINLPSLRSLTQAGGSLDLDSRRRAHEYMESVGGRFFVLYGQTEAAPRMTTLQHDDFEAAPQSVGKPLPGCRIEIREPDSNGHGEVIFYGPNVMLGYAQSREDLATGDEMVGQLPTGDVGYLDDAGRLTLIGRAKRMGKLYGLRINLDEVEMLASASSAAAVTQRGDALTFHVTTTGEATADEVLKQAILNQLRERFTLPPSSYQFRFIAEVPRTERGKIDYLRLDAQT